ncbi:MAG: hypothetical protein EB060_06715 [Proteobacteria bacterium]|nr:hypothetical protein [Pseudomonadota bacterium]
MRLFLLALFLLSANTVFAAEKASTKAVDVKSDTLEDSDSSAKDEDGADVGADKDDPAAEDAYTKDYEGCLNEADSKTKDASSVETADAIYKDVFRKCMTAKGHDVPSDDENSKTDE